MKALELTEGQKKLSQPGCFVALHPESNHPDAGRIGKVIYWKDSEILVEFFCDKLIGKIDYCTVPFGNWAPVPDFFVEEYEPRAKKRGWRVTQEGLKMFRELDWGYTSATEGKA